MVRRLLQSNFSWFLLTFVLSRGIINAFGTFQAYYETDILSSFSPSEISWIGTLQGFLLLVIGVLSGPLYDLGYLRGLMFAGTGFIFLGFLLAGEVNSYFGVILSLSLMVGLGCGCLFIPSLAIVAPYFTTKRPLATGITAAGGSFGGVLFPIAFKQTLDHVGYSWGCRVLAFMVLGTQIVPFILLEPLSMPKQKRKLFEPHALKVPSFLLYSIALFFVFAGLYVPFFFVSSYAEEELGVDTTMGFYLLSIMNAGSFFGRIGLNLLANRLGSMPVCIACILLSGVLAFLWIPVHTFAGFVVWGIIYGVFSGAVVSLVSTAMVAISSDLSKFGTRLGMASGFAGFGLLVGSPIAGAILTSHLSWEGTQVFTGIIILFGCAALIAAWMVFKMSEKKRKPDAV